MPIRAEAEHLEIDPARVRNRGLVLGAHRRRFGGLAVGRVDARRVNPAGAGEFAVEPVGEAAWVAASHIQVLVEGEDRHAREIEVVVADAPGQLTVRAHRRLARRQAEDGRGVQAGQ